MSSPGSGLRGEQHPRVAYTPPSVSSSGDEAIECARLAGLILDPWQEFAVHQFLGEREDGKWAAFEIACCVPRQNGKGGIIECLELAGLFVFGEKAVIHSAHEFSTARAAFRRMEDLIAGVPEFSKKVRRISHTNGDEGFDFFNGQSLKYRTRTKSGGRGLTGDRVILDEAMILPETMISSLMPTMSARSIDGNPQMAYFGSSVDQLVHDHGVVFSRVRHRALAGGDPSLAYLEWSVDAGSPDDLEDEVKDEAAWAQANPALGIRIAAEHVAKEQRSMDSRSFAVERLGVGDWPAVDDGADSVFDMDKWRAALDATSEVLDPVAFGFDVSPNRNRGSIGVAGKRKDGLWHAELIDRRHGTDWIVPRLVELRDKFEGASFTCDGKGPAASLVPELEQEGFVVETLSASDQAQACGFMFDAIENFTVKVVPANELNAAVKGAVQRPLVDAWAFSRKNSHVDITPIVAVTDALWIASAMVPEMDPVFAWA